MIRVLASVVLLGVAVTARANDPVEIATARITGPPGEPTPVRYLFGLHVATPVPSADVSDTDVGVHVGGTFTVMHTSVGVGLDFAYQYWPASTSFKETFNTLLRQGTWGFLELAGTPWRFSALQTTPYAKLVVPARNWGTTWLKVGAGLYLVNPNIRGVFTQDGLLVQTDHSKGVWIPGFNVSVGMDFLSSTIVAPGLEASFHYVGAKEDFGSDFRGFAAGMHVMFGR